MAFYILLQGVLLHSLLSNLDTNLQMSSTCALCIIELALKIIACTLFVFIEVDIRGGGVILIPPVCFTCLCSSSFSSVGICCHLMRLATAGQLYLFICFDFYFLFICANIKDFVVLHVW